MHPVLLSIANIKASVRMKASSHAFALVGYLPIPKFPDTYSAEVKAALTARLFHECFSIISEPLQDAERNGTNMSDGAGHLRIARTPVVSHIADWPEQRMIHGVSASSSPISMATTSEFGDSQKQPRRNRDKTLSQIEEACKHYDPVSDLARFVAYSKTQGLLGVIRPYWQTWGEANPPDFLTPDPLHAWHIFF